MPHPLRRGREGEAADNGRRGKLWFMRIIPDIVVLQVFMRPSFMRPSFMRPSFRAAKFSCGQVFVRPSVRPAAQPAAEALDVGLSLA
jgi:hypothetical protein